jgi:hypothetical protein
MANSAFQLTVHGPGQLGLHGADGFGADGCGCCSFRRVGFYVTFVLCGLPVLPYPFLFCGLACFGFELAEALPVCLASLLACRGWLFRSLPACGKCAFIMPNKSIKVTARRSGWESQFFSQVGGFVVSNQQESTGHPPKQ